MSGRLIFGLAVLVGSLVIAGVSLWAISQGVVTSETWKRLAAFVVLCAAALSLVALLSCAALLREFTFERAVGTVNRAVWIMVLAVTAGVLALVFGIAAIVRSVFTP